MRSRRRGHLFTTPAPVGEPPAAARTSPGPGSARTLARRALVALVAVGGCLGSPLCAADVVTGERLTYAQRVTLPSAILGESRTLAIALPESFDAQSERQLYPVVFVSDVEFFPLVTAVVRHLAAMERMPESLVVGLEEGVVVPPLFTNGNRYWPADWNRLRFGASPEPFVRHFREELIPYLRETFRAADYRIIVGVSGSAGFALHAFCAAPDLFRAYVAFAAGDLLGMGHTEGTSLIEETEACLKKTPGRRAALFVASPSVDVATDPEIATRLDTLERRLAPYRQSGLRLVSKVFPDEGHYDMVLPALGEAFELLFPRAEWFVRYRDLLGPPGTPLGPLDAHYARLSSEVGFPVLPRAERHSSVNSLRRLAWEVDRDGRTEDAIVVIERWIEQRPRSLDARLALAAAVETSRGPAAALPFFGQALALARSTAPERAAELEKRVKEMRAIPPANAANETNER
ncbi:MAG: alpha/beta hydrolase-fold protein [Thermoanaerobaculia bacterium]